MYEDEVLPAKEDKEGTWLIMETLKILYGTTFDRGASGGVQLYDNISKVFSVLLSQNGYVVEKFEFAFSKEKVVKEVESGDYNVIVTDGTISSVGPDGELVRDGIGFSTIKNWLSDAPGMKVIIIEEQASKGKAKIGRLFKELCFYNIVFKPEPFTWKELMTELVEVLKGNRTAAQALKEYGIEGYDDVKLYLSENPWILEGGEKPADSCVSSNIEETKEMAVDDVFGYREEPVEKETVVDERLNKEEEVADTKEEEMSLEEIETMFAMDSDRFKAFDDELVEPETVKEDEIESTPVKEMEKDVRKEVADFTFGDFSFGNEEKKNEGNVNDVPIAESVTNDIFKSVEEAADFHFEFEKGGESKRASDILTQPVYREMGNESAVATLQRGSRRGNSIAPARGIISSVVDYDTILIEFDNIMDGMEHLDEYRCIVKVRSGNKGMVVNGRYKSANISFDAYLDAIVGDRAVMMEVPEFDCEEKRDFLEGKECNFVFVKI